MKNDSLQPDYQIKFWFQFFLSALFFLLFDFRSNAVDFVQFGPVVPEL